ncbi:hypothetical protein [Mycolicibacterium komossense]|uniref:Lipoprotein n=1 Tax=Mycolicibacterium komossense TaxID=1779 RepID=A0ABT3CG65_9MYCO|nr:hypothetical protein [Mycolicibacterium komossense]MCV7228442.1 hypothetical protein [Mycolicibacterium komossense]
MGLKKAACKVSFVGATVLVAAWTAASGMAVADPTTPDPAPPAPVGPAPGPTPSGSAPAAPATSISTDGTFTVGTDIAPGTYSTAGPVGDGACYWKRMSNAASDNIIDNALTKKPQIVQIEATDAKFKTSGCQPWTLTDQAPPSTGPTGLLGQLQLGAIMGDLNNRAAQAPPAP